MLFKLSNTNWSTGGERERARTFFDNEVWQKGTLWQQQLWSPEDMGQIDAPEFLPAGSTIARDFSIGTSIFVRDGWL